MGRIAGALEKHDEEIVEVAIPDDRSWSDCCRRRVGGGEEAP